MEKENRIKFRFLLVTDRLHCPGNFLDRLNEAIIAGVDAVQLREKDLSGGSYLQLAQAVKQMTNPQNIPLIINERIDVAVAALCHGVHLGGSSFPTVAVRKFLGPQYLIGKSTHHQEEVLSGSVDGADYIRPCLRYTIKEKIWSSAGN